MTSTSPRSTYFWMMLRLVALILFLATIAGFAARQSWLFDICSGFRLHYLILLSLLCFIFLIARKGGMMLLAAAFALTNLWPVASAWVPRAQADTESQQVRVMVASIEPGGMQTDSLAKAVRRDSVDVVAIFGLDTDAVRRIRSLLREHRYVMAQPRKDPFGVMILSRYPLTAGRIATIGRSQSPVVLAECTTPGGDFTLVAARLLAPESRAMAAERNVQLADLGTLVEKAGERVLLLSRLELTQWSPWFDDLLARGNLRDGRSGIGVVATSRGAMMLPGQPLDHLLVSEGLSVVAMRVIDAGWSDRLPLTGDIGIRIK